MWRTTLNDSAIFHQVLFELSICSVEWLSSCVGIILDFINTFLTCLWHRVVPYLAAHLDQRFAAFTLYFVVAAVIGVGIGKDLPFTEGPSNHWVSICHP